MALADSMLVYLEIWGLMSRGYTLGIILTLYNAGRLLSEAEVSRSYRGGEGLAWIMCHRVGGLMAAGLVAKRNEDLVLTPLRGRIVAHLYRISIFVLGVRRTG
jgi:hypothetical protein